MPTICVRVYKLQNQLDKHFMLSEGKIEANQNFTYQISRFAFHRFSATNNWSYSQRKAEQSNFTASFPTHSDVLFNIYRFTAYPSTISDADYQRLSKNSLQGQIIKNTTNFFMNFAKFK